MFYSLKFLLQHYSDIVGLLRKYLLLLCSQTPGNTCQIQETSWFLAFARPGHVCVSCSCCCSSEQTSYHRGHISKECICHRIYICVGMCVRHNMQKRLSGVWAIKDRSFLYKNTCKHHICFLPVQWLHYSHVRSLSLVYPVG